jgi:hypothetical protein
MDVKLAIILALVAVCAVLVGLLVSSGFGEDRENRDAGNNPAPLQPPALPEEKLAQAANNSSGLSDIFGNPNGIQPPALPS